MTITLSGGNYGGETRDVSTTETEIRITDDGGVVWIYRIDGDLGVFTGCA